MSERFYTQETEDSAGTVTYTTFSSRQSIPVRVDVYRKQCIPELSQKPEESEYDNATGESDE